MNTSYPKRTVKYGCMILNIHHANKNEGLPKHSHNESHLIICHAGSCIVRKENKELIINKDSTPLNLVANEWHEIEALEDNTVFVNIFDSKCG